ncbi:MAG: PorV/PorQ family protein [Ignavibacteriae bacterium]|nr:PorV/PorQ family protein [Ignavibacteriota bacterium]
MKLSQTKIILILLVVMFAASISYAGPRKKYGTSAAPELLIPVGSVGTSLLGSNMSYISGVDAMYWNPAGLASINSRTGEVMFSHVNYFAGMKLEYVSVASKVGSLGVIGAGIKSFNIGEFEQTTEIAPDGTGTIFKPTYITANLSFARQMTDRIRFGTNVKVISESVADVSASGFAFDFGIQYKGGETGFNFGIAIKNLGSTMRFNGPGLDRTIQGVNGQISTQRVVLQDFDLPTALDMGISWGKMFKNDMGVTVGASFTNNSFTSDEFKFGLDCTYKNILYIRGSYNVLVDKESGKELSMFGPSIGAGLHYPVGGVNLGFDYAYRFINSEASAFNSTNQFFTVSLGF